MVAIKKPFTLVRMGRYDSPLAEAVKKSSENLQPTELGLGNTVKYGSFKKGSNPYLLIIAQQKDRLVNPDIGHNVVLSVTSYSGDTNKQVADRFETETGMCLDIDVPEHIQQYYNETDQEGFNVFEENPEGAMRFFLRGF